MEELYELAELLAKVENGDELRAFIDLDVEIWQEDGGEEFVDIQRDEDGRIIVATSRKLPNLKLRLGEFLLQAVGSGVAVAGAYDKPLKLALAVISFVRGVRKLATVEIHERDAELLIVIFKLTLEMSLVSMDLLLASVGEGWTEEKVNQSLERLDKVGCVSWEMEGVRLNEEILVRGTN